MASARGRGRLYTSPQQKRGGDQRELEDMPEGVDPRQCERCGRQAHIHLYILGESRVRGCLDAQCTWITCVHCGRTWDTQKVRSIPSVWAAKLGTETDQLVRDTPSPEQGPGSGATPPGEAGPG